MDLHSFKRNLVSSWEMKFKNLILNLEKGIEGFGEEKF